jgi:hypothetical protein
VTYICPTKFSDAGFCPTKFKLCPTKIKSDRTNVLSSQIFICSPEAVAPDLNIDRLTANDFWSLLVTSEFFIQLSFEAYISNLELSPSL